MSTRQILLILLATALIAVGATAFLYHGVYLKDVRTIPLDFYVEEGVMGINTDDDALHMGGMTPGGFSTRRLRLDPKRESRLVATPTGVAGAFVTITPNETWLIPGNRTTLEVRVDAPTWLPEGNYTGNVTLHFYRW